MVGLSYVWIVLVFFMASMANDFIGFASVFVVLSSPAALIIWFMQIRPKKIAKQNEEANRGKVVDLVGTLPRFHHFESSTAIAVNESKGEIILSDAVAGIFRSYPFSSIRGWEVREETAGSQGSTILTGTSGAAAAQGAMMVLGDTIRDSKAKAQAALNTGLYLTVKDIDHPEWRVAMISQSDRKRWFEILNQTLNEGGAA